MQFLIRIRGHHIDNILGILGVFNEGPDKYARIMHTIDKGYSIDFYKKTFNLVEKIKKEKDLEIAIVTGPDDICNFCDIAEKDNSCYDGIEEDAIGAEANSFRVGETYPSRYFIKLIELQINSYR